MADTLKEETIFIEDSNDDMTTPGKNRRLARSLNTDLLKELIVRIDRIEIGFTGWNVTVRRPDAQ